MTLPLEGVGFTAIEQYGAGPWARLQLADPQTIARGAVVEVKHPRFGTVRQVASPLRVGDDAARPPRPFPRRAHRHDASRPLRLRPGDADRLRASGIFGPPEVVHVG